MNTTTDMTDWWLSAVVYQVYIRSFADGDDDGTGDIRGLRSKLGYLAELGVDAIWITPWYPSPLRDGGYDITDYCNIDPRFGTLQEAENLIIEAHEFDIRVIIDLVPNHTSSDHRWFREALADGPGSPARDRYIFRPGRGSMGERPPCDWLSVFGGSAWEPLGDGEWYLHLFDSSQPDLNWENPDIRSEFDSILRFWLDRGVDGIRVDVAHGMIKDTSFPDIGEATELLGRGKGPDHPHWNRDEVHHINRRWRRILEEYDGRMMVAEAWLPSDQVALYLRPDEYHQSFNFDLLVTPWDASCMAEVIDHSLRSAAQVGAAPTWVLSNHDVMRHSTRYALPADTAWRSWPITGSVTDLDQLLGDRRARAAVLISMALPGSTYLYQGEELGLPEAWDLPTEVLVDPVWERSGRTQRGRDGCRVPLPWTAQGPSCGFSSGQTPPWLPQPDIFHKLAVDQQDGNQESMLELYRAAIRLRREVIGVSPEFRLIDSDPAVLIFERSAGFRCVVNFSDQPIPRPTGRVVLCSDIVDVYTLASDTAVWLIPN